VGNELALPLHGRASNNISPITFIRLFEILLMLNLFNANNLRPEIRKEGKRRREKGKSKKEKVERRRNGF